MLDPFIIEEIRRREEQERRDQEHRLPLELPLEAPRYEPEASPPPVDNDRGVIVIDVMG